MKITGIKATTVTVPLEAPLRHSAGCHGGRFARTIVEVPTDEGIVGGCKMRGGGKSAECIIAPRHQGVGFSRRTYLGRADGDSAWVECFGEGPNFLGRAFDKERSLVFLEHTKHRKLGQR